MISIANKTKRYYDDHGWKVDGKYTKDAIYWEDLRENAYDYIRKCRRRILRHIPPEGDKILDMGSGPIQYSDYLLYSRGFRRRICIDLSFNALKAARMKIGNHGIYINANFLDIPLKKNYFDCAISLHALYHFPKDRQEEAVRKLIYVTKPCMPIIIVYSNPNTILSNIKPYIYNEKFIKMNNIIQTRQRNSLSEIYFYRFPVEWWKRFNSYADVKIYPWRSFKSVDQKILIPDNRLGKLMLSSLFVLEELFPSSFVKHFQYPLIVLTKHRY